MFHLRGMILLLATAVFALYCWTARWSDPKDLAHRPASFYLAVGAYMVVAALWFTQQALPA